MAVSKQARKSRTGPKADAAPKVVPRVATTETETSPAYQLEHQIGFMLRCVHQRATEIFNAQMSHHGVTPTQFAVLAKLSDLGSVSQNQLGRLTAMDPATTSGVVGRLLTRGLVAQSPAAEDARLVLLSLTPEGKVAIAAMKADAAKVSARTLEPLDAAEVTTLLDVLSKLK